MGIEPEKEKDTKSMKGEINKITIFARKTLTRLHMSISIRNSQRMQMWQFPTLNSYILQQSM